MVKSGFTLIELLVSISIVAIVFGIIISSSSAIQRASRDAQRRADLANVQTALQHCQADNLKYPASLTLTAGTSLTCFTRVYLSKIPADPTGGSYTYKALPDGCDNSSLSGNCLNYCLYADLESPPVASSLPPVCAPFSGTNNYWVTQP